MAEFDPYLYWLKIPADEQPPDHYLLLGLERFESDSDTIQNAIHRRVEFLQDVSHGEHVEHAQQLLNQVAKARVCLTDPAQKLAYDQCLRSNDFPEVAIQQTRSRTETLLLDPKTKTVAGSHSPPFWLFALIGGILLLVIAGSLYLLLDDRQTVAAGENQSAVASDEAADPSLRDNETTASSSHSTSEFNPESNNRDDVTIGEPKRTGAPETAVAQPRAPVSEDFENVQSDQRFILTQPFESPLGTWIPGTGVGLNRIRDPGKTHLHLTGGGGHSVVLQLNPELPFPAILEMNVERWTQGDPLAKKDFFEVHASTDNRNWNLLSMTPESQPIQIRQRSGPVPWKISYELNGSGWKFIKFTCNSSQRNAGEGGILIGQVTFRPVLPLPRFGD